MLSVERGTRDEKLPSGLPAGDDVKRGACFSVSARLRRMGGCQDVMHRTEVPGCPLLPASEALIF